MILNADFASCLVAEQGFQIDFFVQFLIHDNSVRNGSALVRLQIKLPHKGFRQFRQIGIARHFREVAAIAQNLTLTNKQNLHAGHAELIGDGNNINVVMAIVGDKLFFNYRPYRLNLIANARRFFKIQLLTCLFHLLHQMIQHLLIFSL